MLPHYTSTRKYAQLLAPALVRRLVLRPVLLAAVRRNVALAALDVLCSLLALWIVASSLKLLAKAHVRWPVLDAVLVAAVRGDVAPAALVQGLILLFRRARWLITDLCISPQLPCSLGKFGGRFLFSEKKSTQKGRR
jgi:hypothetical protein